MHIGLSLLKKILVLLLLLYKCVLNLYNTHLRGRSVLHLH